MAVDTGKATRVAIFVDHDNFTGSYCNRHRNGSRIGPFKTVDMAVWDSLCDTVLGLYRERFVTESAHALEHVGTYLCVGMSHLWCHEQNELRDYFRELDRKNGYIVKYGTRAGAYIKERKIHWGEEKGVDAEIICQMLVGAFQDHYDVAILMSDDADYLPAVTRVQDFLGKRVIHAGFGAVALRERCYGHIPLEEADEHLRFPAASGPSA
jgi:uncharacterized LabA/DUF88 family protein